VRGRVGSRVWLVPDDEALEPWLLEDAESPGQHPGADSLELTGLDDHEGPPEGHRDQKGYEALNGLWLSLCGAATQCLEQGGLVGVPQVLR
jgi:hypothetical protein